MTEADLALARRYISSHIQLRRMFRHHPDESPEESIKQIEYDEAALDRELDKLEAELDNDRSD